MRWVVVAYQEFSELVMTTVEDYVAAWEAGSTACRRARVKC